MGEVKGGTKGGMGGSTEGDRAYAGVTWGRRYNFLPITIITTTTIIIIIIIIKIHGCNIPQ